MLSTGVYASEVIGIDSVNTMKPYLKKPEQAKQLDWYLTLATHNTASLLLTNHIAHLKIILPRTCYSLE